MGQVCSTLCKDKDNDEIDTKPHKAPPTQSKNTQKASKHHSHKHKKETKSSNNNKNKPTSQSGGHKEKSPYEHQNIPTGESQSHSQDRLPRQKSMPSKISTDDFDFFKYLGKGSYGKVALVKKKSNGQFFAMKIVKKKDFVMNRITIENAMVEREILMKSHHPFVVNLKYSFQDSSSIYFVMDYVAGG